VAIRDGRFLAVGSNAEVLRLPTRDQFLDPARKAHNAGWQLATHANGDLAIEPLHRGPHADSETPQNAELRTAIPFQRDVKP
jgi:predicted amidohydrolase YtcJ